MPGRRGRWPDLLHSTRCINQVPCVQLSIVETALDEHGVIWTQRIHGPSSPVYQRAASRIPNKEPVPIDFGDAASNRDDPASVGQPGHRRRHHGRHLYSRACQCHGTGAASSS